MERQQQYHSAHLLLRCIVFGVLVYGSGMVLAGRVVAATLFDTLGFGPSTHALDENGERYAMFCFGVLGSVIVGWMLSLYTLLDMCDLQQSESSGCGMNRHHATIRQSARRGIFLSGSIWFLFDTTFSIVISEYNHALFNIPFVMLFLLPLHVMHRNDDGDEETLSWSEGEDKPLAPNANFVSSTNQRGSTKK